MPTLLPLPIDDVLPQVVAALRQSPCAVLRAPPGAGKTTRVPPALLDSGLAGKGKILVLQPRRVAARATAARMASERGTRLGEEVGYQVRFDSRTGPRTKIEVLTEGILLRMLHEQPFLEGISAIIFDEFHERSLSSDLALGMVRQIQQSVRPDLKVLVMSATLAAEPIAAYLGGCGVVESAGRMFPVAIRYLAGLEKRPIEESVLVGVEQVLRESAGDVLVFLPGVGEIRKAGARLEGLAEEQNLAVMELYGDLPAEQQDAVLAPGQRRKVILATNVAETSLTIEGVTAVVDSGLARIQRLDEQTGLDRLELCSISRASADQRAGRAGRTQSGVCLRLWPEAAHRHRAEYETPEVHRVDLAGAVLQLAAWIEPDYRAFPWFDAPEPAALARAEGLLTMLGSLHLGKITPLGTDLAALPVHPRIARLLVEGRRLGAPDETALLAAMLSERDPFFRSGGPQRRSASHTSQSDVLDRLHALQDIEDRGIADSAIGSINRQGAKQIFKVREQLRSLTERMGSNRKPNKDPASSDDAVLRSILAAYPDRVARRRESGGKRAVMVGGRGVKLADESAVLESGLFVCVQVDGAGGEGLVRQASGIQSAWLGSELLQTETIVEFDEQRESVAAKKQVTWNGLLLEESQAALPSGEKVEALLASAAAERLERVYPKDNEDFTQFVTRVQCLAAWRPDWNLPPLDDATFRELLPMLVSGCRSFADLRKGPWLHAAKSLFTYPQLQLVDREAPERIEVPSGSQVAVQYEVGRPPILAVRIQEVFGLLDTPRLAGGKVPVLMHLLAPNMRVAQVTDDLRSFWTNTYILVRKDLRNRYPKHSWPEDPFTAEPQRRPQRR
ncbi:MAG: ATP-dependent helicase HrpB [Pirellulaceae bacterium]